MDWKMEKLKNLWQLRRVKIGLGIVIIGALMLKPGNDANRINPDSAHFCRVQRGDLVVSILQSGELKARSSRDIINEAARDAKIVEIVDDGEVVTNGQLLVELESSDLRDRFLQQKAKTASAEAELMHSKEELEIAKLKYATDLDSAVLRVDLARLDLQKYTEAEYQQMVLKAESDISLAEQELKKARSELEGTKELYEKGYSNRQELESDELGVDRKEIEVRNKTKDLEILENYTYVKRLKELENNVANAESALERLKKTHASEMLRNEARLESRKTSLTIEENQLEHRETSLEKTKIHADFEGQVFYPKGGRYSYRNETIEKGATVNYRQKMLSFPDLTAWDIRVGIPEAMIDKVSVGQSIVASLDAVPGLLLHGQIKWISAVPDSQNWYSSGVKTYTIKIDVLTTPEEQLKPGMSATVEIVTDQLRDVLYVPIQSVVSDKNKHYVYVVKRGRKELREVSIGKYNNTSIEIVDGLKEGEELLLYAEVELETDTRLKQSPLAMEKKVAGEQEMK
jgi:HlyD family secretion protein